MRELDTPPLALHRARPFSFPLATGVNLCYNPLLDRAPVHIPFRPWSRFIRPLGGPHSSIFRESTTLMSLLCIPPRRLSAWYCLALMLTGLGVCGLSARVSAATLSVTSTADDGSAGTLRATLAAAMPGDTVNVGVAGTITLTQGELPLNKSLTLIGPGASNLTIDGGGTGRVFHQMAATTGTTPPATVVTVSGLTVTNGSVTGNGGGLLVDSGSLTLTGCVVASDGAQVGGGVYVATGATIAATGCTFSGNASQTNGGGLWAGVGVAPSLANCVFDSNAAYGGFGGGLFTGGGATATRCAFTNNYSGGTSAVVGSTRLGGGGISSTGGRLTLTTCVADSNQAETGGGVYTDGPLTAAASTISNNTATASGVSGGGLVADADASGTLTNCTVADNSALNGSGGGLRLHAALTLTNCTVTGNMASSGAGGGIATDAPAGLALTGMLIAGNAAQSDPDVSGAFRSGGSNLLGDGTGSTGLTNGINSDQVGTASSPIDAKLGQLSDNGGPAFQGGPTFTVPLLVGSPAVDADFAASPNADQRGVRRPIGPRADIGAYEAPIYPTAPTNVRAQAGDRRVTLTWTGTAGATSYNVYRSTTPGGATAGTVPLATGIQGTVYTDTGLINGVTYYYVVRGVNAGGVGPPSSPEAAATPSDSRIRGSVLAWGGNTSGQLGTGIYTASQYPTPVAAPSGTSTPLISVVAVAGGARFSLALTAGGRVYSWGDDQYGQLGDNGNAGTRRNTPGLVVDSSGVPLAGIVAIAAGQDHALALAADGTVYAWGRNQYGQLGNSFTSDYLSSAYPVYDANFNPISAIAVAAGGYHSLAVLANGTALAWGYNSNGQLGNGTEGANTGSATPKPVSGLTNAVAVAAGQYHSLALLSNGRVSAWGYDLDGELGDGGSQDSDLPKPVPIQSSTAGGAAAITQISAGQYHSLALADDGTLYAWGSNTSGQLGVGDTASRFSPQAVPVGGATVLSAAAGELHSLALLGDHTALAWGSDASGQLGDGATANSPNPQPVRTANAMGGPQTSLYALAGGGLHSLAVLNQPPTAMRDSYVVHQGTTRTVAAPGVLANDTDAENEPLTAILVKQAAHGTVTLRADGGFDYTPNAGFVGVDGFTYRASDSTAPGTTASVTITVTNPALTSITVVPAAVTVAQNATQQFMATASYADGTSSDATQGVTWSSSDTTVASVSNAAGSHGLATATPKLGSATITATLADSQGNTRSGTGTLTVARTLMSLTVAPASASIAKGQQQQFTATAAYTDGFTQDATTSVNWASSNAAVAPISNRPATATRPGTQGLATGAQQGGPITIQATLADALGHLKTGTAALTVTAAVPVSISIAPAPLALTRNAGMGGGNTRQLTATETSSDGTKTDVSQTVTWSSDNPIVATVDANGFAAAVGVGRTTITATADGLTGTDPVSVTDPTLAPKTHLLWNLNSGVVSVWDVDTQGNYVEHLYGPYAGWRAVSHSTGPDGRGHILWDKTDGTMSLWTVNADGGFTFHNYGPYPGWTAVGLSTDPSNVSHVLWNHSPDGLVSVWATPADGSFTYQNYGPYAGYTATSITSGPDGVTHIAWNKTDGTVSLWDGTPDVPGFAHYEYGPYPGWSVSSLSVGTDNVVHLLWNKTDGTTSFWVVDGRGGFTPHDYGPYSGWTAVGVSTGPDNVSHIFWGRTDGTASLWDVDSQTGSFNYRLFGPLPSYHPVALSSGT